MTSTRHALGEFLTTQSAQIPWNEFVLNLILTALLAFILAQVYVRFASALSNRDLFARNFVVLAMTTMLIISIVKSSLALSLGLVGALSIVRFRAAIKEPEELAYLFLAISVGLGFGASQTLLTLIAFFIIISIVTLKHFVHRDAAMPNFFLTVTSAADSRVNLPTISEILRQHSSGALLTRFDATPDAVEASFRVQFDSVAKLHSCNDQLRLLAQSVRVSYLEARGVGA